MAHWLQTVVDLLQAPTTDLRELAKLAGANPKVFYRGARFRDGLDISGQDLRGMEFTDLDITKVTTDARTRVDPRYAGPNQHQPKGNRETLGPEVQTYDGQYSNWLGTWTSARTGSEREAAAQEGEALLSSTQSILPPEWPIIWHKIWLAERRNSDRRKRLLELARPNVLRGESNILGWAAVFRRLWQSASQEERLRLAEFANRTLNWMAEQDERTWIQSWNEVSQALKLPGIESSRLYEIGFRWLTSQDFNHPNWPSVWRSLWLLDREPRSELIELAIHWLSKVDSQNTDSWSKVWRRLLKYLKGTGDDEGLLNLTISWLSHNPESSEWPLVWQALLPRIKDRNKAWLVSSGLAWLEANLRTHNGKWLFVWKAIQQHSPLDNEERVMIIGLRWLAEEIARPEWPNVWLRLWKAGYASMRSELERQAEAWLKTNSEHAASASIQGAILQYSLNI
jgi:hypothetical protein